ncbi:MAG TPA: serine/threonine-protein kinase, partial [Candidatus Methylomirabilis sp.]|nr:serine/threonine-protein kinase [Candidatus Methylomirabilis sp.]
EVALKVCRFQTTPEQAFREFRMLRDLRHPGIARSYDFGLLPGEGSAYFTLEYLSGSDIERKSAELRRHVRPDDPGPLLGLMLQVTSALGYLHRKGLLHLDLKPSNVVVSGGKAKLIDFGLFQHTSLQDARPARGTAYFMAPELFEGGPIDRRADLYSLGVTLYRSFTGRYPIPGRTLEEIERNHRQHLPDHPGGLPEGLSRIILKLLAKSPMNRFQSAEDVFDALGALLPGGPAPEAAVIEEPDFVGRKKELDSFFSWLHGIEGPRGPRVLLIEGPAGAGKSRLADACMTEILGMGGRVIPITGPRGPDRDGLRLLFEKVLTLCPLPARERGRYR